MRYRRLTPPFSSSTMTDSDWLRWLDRQQLAPSVLPTDTGICRRCHGSVHQQENGEYWNECYDCRKTHGKFIDGLIPICFSLDKGLESAIAQAKDSPQHAWLQRPLAALLWAFLDRHATCIERRWKGIDIVTVIPPHRSARNGDDHLKNLTSIRTRWPWPADPDLLVKTSPTPADRRRSEVVPGLFEVSARRAVCGRRVVIFDDTYTTGGTIASAAHTLKRAGARAVVAVALGRQLNRNFTPAQKLISQVERRRLDLNYCVLGR